MLGTLSISRALTPVLLCGSVALAVFCPSPAAGAQEKPIVTSLCEISKNPANFDGKLVQLTAKVRTGFEVFAIGDPSDSSCKSAWFVIPGGSGTTSKSFQTGARKGYPPVALRDDRKYKSFSARLKAQMYSREENSMCVSCDRYEITAIMTGLLEVAGAGRFGGFGHMNGYSLQFVLQSVESFDAADMASSYDPAKYSTKAVRFPAGFISGTVLDPDGKPVEGITVAALLQSDGEPRTEKELDFTDTKGKFRLKLKPGSYVIGINVSDLPSGRFPFPATYFPSAASDTGARRVAISDGEQRRNLTIRIARRLPRVSIPVRVVSVDGEGVEKANVWLSPPGHPYEVVGGGGESYRYRRKLYPSSPRRIRVHGECQQVRRGRKDKVREDRSGPVWTRSEFADRIEAGYFRSRYMHQSESPAGFRLVTNKMTGLVERDCSD